MSSAVFLAAALCAAADPRLAELPVAALPGLVYSEPRAEPTPDGLAFPVDGMTAGIVSVRGAQTLELDYLSEGPLLLTYATVEPGQKPRMHGPPWRYVEVPEGRGTLRLDLRTAMDWRPSKAPYLVWTGTGRFTITRFAYLPVPASEAEGRRALDVATRWAPLPLGHSTINALEAAWWSVTEVETVPDVLGRAFLALAVAAAAGLALARRRARAQGRAGGGVPWPAAAVGLAAVVVALLGNLHLAVRAGPMVQRPALDPEVRIRDGQIFSPELGRLAALARARLPASDRVAVYVKPSDWVGRELLCFHLAPRPCVFLQPGAPEHRGLSGVDRLRTEEVDAIVAFHPPGPLPEGFHAVAAATPSATVARR